MKLKEVNKFILLMCLMSFGPYTLAIEEVVVYGQRVPTGFYEYTLNLQMSQQEFQSLYTSSGHVQGGLSPLAQAMIQWNNRCGGILGNLMHSFDTCEKLVGEHYLETIDYCALAANTSSVSFTASINHSFLGGSVTWAPPSHQYSDCVNKATGHRDNLWQACENGFEAAKHARTDCRGAGSW